MKNAKKLLLYLPYAVFALLGTKLGQAVRMAPGKGFSEKAMHILEGFQAAFASWLPSFAAVDLLVGLLCAGILWLVLYEKKGSITFLV